MKCQMAVCIADPEAIVQNFRYHIDIIGKRRTEPKHPGRVGFTSGFSCGVLGFLCRFREKSKYQTFNLTTVRFIEDL
jgi:hypothetical protein